MSIDEGSLTASHTPPLYYEFPFASGLGMAVPGFICCSILSTIILFGPHDYASRVFVVNYRFIAVYFWSRRRDSIPSTWKKRALIWFQYAAVESRAFLKNAIHCGLSCRYSFAFQNLVNRCQKLDVLQFRWNYPKVILKYPST